MKKVKFAIRLGILAAVAVFVATPGCAPRKRFDPTPEGEFEAAYQAYEKKKYPTAIDAFKQLIYKYPGSDLVEQGRYYLADSYFLNGENLLAANEFELLNREFPQGRFADVSLYKAGIAYSRLSRRPERDQNETRKALETLETLLTKYPNTEYRDSIRAQVRSLKDKLAQKEFDTAQFYIKRKLYDSSIIYLKSVLTNYPESSIMPDVLYNLYVASKKMGYPDDAQDARNWLCKDYPETEYGKVVCGENAPLVSDSTRANGEKKKN